MKFNNTQTAIVMNPPYQYQSENQKNRTGGKTQAKPLYHKFIESAIDDLKCDHLVSINPSRWFAGGMGLNKFRERMMNDRSIKTLVQFSGSKEIFPSVNIKGGVNYFNWDKSYDGKCKFVNGNTTSDRFLNEHDIIVQDNNAFNIIDKILCKSTNFINETCLSNKPFGLATNFKDWTETGTKCIASRNTEHYVNPTAFVDKNNVLGKYKVCTSAGINPNKEGRFEVYNNLFVLEPNAICTETYIIVNTFDTKVEADNFALYMQTKFFRFMLGTRVLSQHINTQKFAFVPNMLDYSVPWTDKELYKKFNLIRQEIAYIESKIKAI